MDSPRCDGYSFGDLLSLRNFTTVPRPKRQLREKETSLRKLIVGLEQKISGIDEACLANLKAQLVKLKCELEGTRKVVRDKAIKLKIQEKLCDSLLEKQVEIEKENCLLREKNELFEKKLEILAVENEALKKENVVLIFSLNEEVARAKEDALTEVEVQMSAQLPELVNILMVKIGLMRGTFQNCLLTIKCEILV